MEAYGLKILSQLVSSLLRPKEEEGCDLLDGSCDLPDKNCDLPDKNCDLPDENFDLPDGSFDNIDVSPTPEDQSLSSMIAFVIATTLILLYLFPVIDK